MAARPRGSRVCSSDPRARDPLRPWSCFTAVRGSGPARERSRESSGSGPGISRDLGYVVLLVDSFTTRGIDEVCTGRHVLSPVRDRADDARGALRYLQARADVQADRIGLLGWSNGAAATLSVLFDRGTAQRDFRAAVAFYPNCTRNYPGGPDFRPYAPLYVLMGALDDWTPAAPCMTLVERAQAAGAPIAIKVYPGAHHSFDAPATPLRYRPEVTQPQQARRLQWRDRGNGSRRPGRRDRGGHRVPRGQRRGAPRLAPLRRRGPSAIGPGAGSPQTCLGSVTCSHPGVTLRLPTGGRKGPGYLTRVSAEVFRAAALDARPPPEPPRPGTVTGVSTAQSSQSGGRMARQRPPQHTRRRSGEGERLPGEPRDVAADGERRRGGRGGRIQDVDRVRRTWRCGSRPPAIRPRPRPGPGRRRRPGVMSAGPISGRSRWRAWTKAALLSDRYIS